MHQDHNKDAYARILLLQVCDATLLSLDKLVLKLPRLRH